MSLTLSQAQETLQSYIDAERQILKGQSYTHNGRSVTMANLAEIQAGRKYWEKRVAEMSGRRKARRVMLGGR
jgi:hypothetical protein